MINVLAFFMLLIFISVLCIWLYLISRYFSRFKSFGNYLISIGDVETLVYIGGSPEKGGRKVSSVPFPLVHTKLMNKYNETNNEEYLKFDKYLLKSGKHIAFLFLLGFFVFIFFSLLSKINKSF